MQPTHGMFGTGLSALGLAAVITLSLTLFVFWPGPLWQASNQSAHMGRISLSYVAIIPSAAAALWFEKTFSLRRLINATALLWSIKLLITVTLYGAMAPGTSSRYQPATPWSPSSSPVQQNGDKAAPSR